MFRSTFTSATLLFVLVALAGTSCPIGGTSSNGFPRTAAWTRRTVNGNANVRPSVVATADIDNDGKLDVIAGYPGTDTVTAAVIIFFQETVENFTPVTTATSSDLAGIRGLAVADLDGDSLRDIVVAANGRIIYIHSPSSDPRNAAGWSSSTIDNSSGTGIGQWNDVAIGSIDGLFGPDILACNENVGRLCWFKSPAANIANGTGWTRIDIDATNRLNASSVALEDLNVDSKLDAISTAPGEAGTASNPRIAWYQNPTDPAVDSWSKRVVGNLAAASRLAIGDLNVDSRNDVVAVNGPGKQIGWYQRPADPTTTWSGFLLTVYTTNTPVDVKITDVDVNNQPDVIVATQTAGSLRWFMPTPGSAQTVQWLENNIIDISESIGRIAIGDIDADGRPDVIAPLLGATTAGDSIAWFENPE